HFHADGLDEVLAGLVFLNELERRVEDRFSKIHYFLLLTLQRCRCSDALDWRIRTLHTVFKTAQKHPNFSALGTRIYVSFVHDEEGPIGCFWSIEERCVIWT